MSVDPNIREQVMEILADPMNLPSELWQYDVQNWVKEAPVFPISQVFGFSQFTANPATEITTQETTTSVTYVDLATVGPTLTGLPDGKYVFVFGGVVFVSAAGTSAIIALNINGSVGANDFTEAGASSVTGIAKATVASLSNNGSSTVKLQYASGSGAVTATFRRRWLVAVRYGNL